MNDARKLLSSGRNILLTQDHNFLFESQKRMER